MAEIIGFVQVKGGAGRSTLATNAAAMLSRRHRTALIDCDLPQGTSASWYVTRKAANLAGDLTLATAKDHRELVEQVKRLSADHQSIVIDAPPRIAEMTRAILILSHLALIPLGASAAEIWAMSDLLQTVDEARKVKPSLDVRILWTRYRGHTKAAQELSEEVRKSIPLPTIKARIGYRVAYPDVLARGLSVMEWHDLAAREEMESLMKEVQRTMVRRKA